MQQPISTFLALSLWTTSVFLTVVLQPTSAYCPSPCKCRSNQEGAIEMNCESKNLDHVPTLRREMDQPLNGILLGHNKISNIYSSTFGGVQSKYISLSGNPLSIIAHDAFSHIRQLHLLDLENCGLKEVNFYPKFTAETRKYYLNMNRNKITKIAKDFVGEVVRRSVADGKRFYIELERNQLKSLDFIGDTCKVKQAHLVTINVKENPLLCDCNLHTALFKVGDWVKINGRCAHPVQYANDQINVFMERARTQCNRTCLDDVKYDCKIHAWTYETNKTCKALPLCKNGAIKCVEPMAGSVRTATGSGTGVPGSLTLAVIILTSLSWLFGP